MGFSGLLDFFGKWVIWIISTKVSMLSQASRSGIFFLVPRHCNDGNPFVQSVVANGQ